MKKIYLYFLSISVIASAIYAYSCRKPSDKYSSPKGYDFTKPDKFNMPSSLQEISGITFYKANSDTVYSVQDEDGRLYRQGWDVKKQSNMKFAPKGDYEDVGFLHERVFVLKSDGDIYSFPVTEAVKKESNLVKVHTQVVPYGEYEGLFADPETNKVYVVCKKCGVDKKTKALSGYVFDYQSGTDSLVAAGEFKLDLKQIKALNSELKAGLSPSALARNPKTNEWYVLSSANKLLLVTDSNWKIKEAHRLNSSMFNQPEGIAFDKDLNLYISNEGDEVIDGNILKFKYLVTERK